MITLYLSLEMEAELMPRLSLPSLALFLRVWEILLYRLAAVKSVEVLRSISTCNELILSNSVSSHPSLPFKMSRPVRHGGEMPGNHKGTAVMLMSNLICLQCGGNAQSILYVELVTKRL